MGKGLLALELGSQDWNPISDSTIINFLLILIKYDCFEDFPEVWTCIDGSNYDYGRAFGYAATPAIPLYLGLMAIAGAYLIKGNLKKDK